MREFNNRIVQNSTQEPLGASETYTGAWSSKAGYKQLCVAVLADVDGTMYIDQKSTEEGATAQSSLSYDIVGGTNTVHRLEITRPFFRVRFVNNGTAQTEFDLCTSAGDYGHLSAPLSLRVGQDADAIVTRSFPSTFDVALNRFETVSEIFKFGYNPEVSTALEDVWTVGGVRAPLVAAAAMEVVSTSVNDISGGSGAQVVSVFGLDANWDEISEEVTLNGTTPVPLANSYLRINRMRVEQVGTYAASNLGTINARVVTGAVVQAQIPFDATYGGLGTSEMSHLSIPRGYSALIHGAFIEVEASKPVNVFGTAIKSANDVITPFVSTRFSEFDFRQTEGFINFVLPVPLLLEEYTDFKFQAYATSVTTGFVSTKFQYSLVKNRV